MEQVLRFLKYTVEPAEGKSNEIFRAGFLQACLATGRLLPGRDDNFTMDAWLSGLCADTLPLTPGAAELLRPERDAFSALRLIFQDKDFRFSLRALASEAGISDWASKLIRTAAELGSEPSSPPMPRPAPAPVPTPAINEHVIVPASPPPSRPASRARPASPVPPDGLPPPILGFWERPITARNPKDIRHAPPANRSRPSESQETQRIQDVLGQTLSKFRTVILAPSDVKYTRNCLDIIEWKRQLKLEQTRLILGTYKGRHLWARENDHLVDYWVVHARSEQLVLDSDRLVFIPLCVVPTMANLEPGDDGYIFMGGRKWRELDVGVMAMTRSGRPGRVISDFAPEGDFPGVQIMRQRVPKPEYSAVLARSRLFLVPLRRTPISHGHVDVVTANHRRLPARYGRKDDCL